MGHCGERGTPSRSGASGSRPRRLFSQNSAAGSEGERVCRAQSPVKGHAGRHRAVWKPSVSARIWRWWQPDLWTWPLVPGFPVGSPGTWQEPRRKASPGSRRTGDDRVACGLPSLRPCPRLRQRPGEIHRQGRLVHTSHGLAVHLPATHPEVRLISAGLSALEREPGPPAAIAIRGLREPSLLWSVRLGVLSGRLVTRLAGVWPAMPGCGRW